MALTTYDKIITGIAAISIVAASLFNFAASPLSDSKISVRQPQLVSHAEGGEKPQFSNLAAARDDESSGVDYVDERENFNIVVDINTADEKALELLPGVGPATAAKIVQYRGSHGPFGSVDELINVDGIGSALLEKLRPYIKAEGTGGEPQALEALIADEPAQSLLININTADESELDKLPGIGPAKAKKIVEYRKSHGLFKSIRELVNVDGIGSKTLDKLRQYITLG